MKKRRCKMDRTYLGGRRSGFHGSREKVRKADTRVRMAESKGLPHR